MKVKVKVEGTNGNI